MIYLRSLHKQFKHLKKAIHIFWQLLSYLWKEEKSIHLRMLLAVVFIISGVLFTIGLPLILKFTINAFKQNNVSHPIIMSIVLFYGLCWTFSQLTSSLQEICLWRVIERSIRSLSSNFMDHLNKLSMRFHANKKTGDLTNALEQAQAAIPIIFYGLIFMVIPTIIEITIATVIFCKMYGLIYGFILLFILITFTLFGMFGSKRILTHRRISTKLHRETANTMMDSLLNFEIIRYFGRQNHELNAFDNILKQKENAETKSLIFLELIHIGHIFILGMGLITLTLLISIGILNGNRNISDLVFVNALVLQFFAPLSSFGDIFRSTYKAFADMEHVFDILLVTSETKDLPTAKFLKVKEGSIKFKNVTFGYDPKNIILNNVSFDINPGETIGIVGTTGMGKSTIPKLLYRFYNVSSGKILIDKQNIKDVKQNSISNAIGIVPQDTILFHNTIGYNIAYGKLDATQDEIAKVAKAVQLEEFVNTLPEKYNTVVGERGLKLSGGEKQKIAMARVLLNDPPIIIFDEATSALDTKTESIIQDVIDSITKGKTTLIISHRLSAIKNVDRVLMINKGTVLFQ